MWSYKPLFRLLLEKDIKKTQLTKLCNLTLGTVAKFSKGEPVTMETLAKICDYFQCGLDDIVEYRPKTSEQK